MPQPDVPVVLITGAAQRVGRTLALGFAASGWHVGVHCHSSWRQAELLVEEIRQGGGRGAVLRADLADMGAVARLITDCSTALGPVHCLVNNAAMFVYDEITTLDRGTWDAQLSVNLKAPVFLAKAFAAQLPAGMDGNIINIIDQRVWKPTPRYFSYTTSKAGLWAATRTLAQALAPRIRVNAIGPGPVLRNTHQSEAEFRAEYRATLLRRATTPQEISAAVQFILEAPALTGQLIALDGGQHLAWETSDVETVPG